MTATGIVSAVFGAAAMWIPAKLARDDGREYRAAGDKAFDAAEELVATRERTKNLPLCWNADPHVTGELVAVAVGPDRCCDGHDTDECNGYGDLSEACCERCPDWDWTPQSNPLPALADEPHHDDEDAPSDDDVHADGFPWWGWLLMPLVIAAVAVLLPFWVLWLAGEWTVGKFQAARAGWRRRRDERHMVGSGEQATDTDPFAEMLATPEPEPVTIVRVNHHYRDPGMTGQFPLVKVVGDKAAGRHRRAEPEMPAINATIPAQRTGGDA